MCKIIHFIPIILTLVSDILILHLITISFYLCYDCIKNSKMGLHSELLSQMSWYGDTIFRTKKSSVISLVHHIRKYSTYFKTYVSVWYMDYNKFITISLVRYLKRYKRMTKKYRYRLRKVLFLMRKLLIIFVINYMIPWFKICHLILTLQE